MKHYIIILALIQSSFSFGQLKLKRTVNSTLSLYAQTHPAWNQNHLLNKWQKADTLNLPFFDDFVSTTVYPDSNRWFNNYVYVNNNFAVNPPSYGVATFDDLDSKGNPYSELNSNTFGACDTLQSLTLNLKDSAGRAYAITDSIYFSFYFQRQGLGDPSDDRVDSLVLQFFDDSSHWVSVWKAKGGRLSPFEFVMFPIINTHFLHKGFKFRYINYSRHTGNLNQWHLDYVHLAKNRRKLNHFYNDFAVQSRPTSLLKDYYRMPYDHFLASPNTLKADSIFFYASNLNNTILNIEARHIESEGANILQSTNFVNNAANLPIMGNAKRRFLSYNITGLTGPNVQIKREYELRESGISSKYVPNDKITVYQEFYNDYAYDDGTAEYGFGYEDDVVDPFLDGAIAYKFNLVKSDTLSAIGMFFNRSVKSSAAFSFNLKVWQSISEVGKGRAQDVSLFTLYNLQPKFTDSINGFHIFKLDTTLVLPVGDFYIGWEQQGNNHIDVGYDINNGYHETESSDKLYWVDRGNWRKVDNFKGALMMRPFFGSPLFLGDRLDVKPIIKTQMESLVYPNPFNDVLNIKIKENLQKVEVYNQNGSLVYSSSEAEMDVSFLNPGLYFVKTLYTGGQVFSQKVLKLH